MLFKYICNPWKNFLMLILIGLINTILTYDDFELYLLDGTLLINNNRLLLNIFLLSFILIIINQDFEFKSNNKYYLFWNVEILSVITLGIIGLLLLIFSIDLISLYISLELYVLSTYIIILTPRSYNFFNKNFSIMNSTLSGISIVYLILGGISSTLILLGILIIKLNLGFTHVWELFDWWNYYLNLNDLKMNNYINFSFFLISIGFLFKLGSVPFHFWVPKLYDSINSIITLFQSVIPKFVYIFVSYLLFSQFYNFSSPIYLLLFIGSLLSLLFGAIGGLTQNKIKKILAYSSINNVGFLLLGLLTSFFINYSSNNVIYSNHLIILHYLFIYSINTIHIFSFILLYFTPFNSNKEFNSPDLKSLLSLRKYYPILSIIIIISIFSMIGLPPFAGFYAKLYIFFSTVISISISNLNNNFILLLIVAIISTLIITSVYLKFVQYLYFYSKNSLNKNFIALNSIYPNSNTFILSLFSFFLMAYPLYLDYFVPLFELSQ